MTLSVCSFLIVTKKKINAAVKLQYKQKYLEKKTNEKKHFIGKKKLLEAFVKFQKCSFVINRV